MASKLQPFRTGASQLFLPKFAIALLRKGGQRPNFATFKVPLRFNKFDLRDYLLHAYNIAVLNVRSQLKPRPAFRRRNGQLVRPLPAKIMTVEMRKPFVWPAKPTDLTPWNSKDDMDRQKSIDRKWNPQRELKKKGTLTLRDERKPDRQKILLRQAAAKLLKVGGWKNNEELDPKFSDPKYRLGKDN